jgi:hypothetical protein
MNVVPEINSLEMKALSTLLTETLFRADRQFAYVLNAGEPGMVETLRQLPATSASEAPAPGRKPIVSHANHVLYGVQLANRALAGEQGVHENANWEVAWQLESVSEQQWHNLVEQLEQESLRLIEQISQPREWTEIELTGTYAIAAHAAYHLGAIRQMLRQLGKFAG